MTATLQPSQLSANLRSRIEARTALIAVIGLGYVGLPLANAFVKHGFSVTGFDTDPEKIARLGAGHSYIKLIPDETIQGMLDSGRFEPVSDAKRLREAEAILICVPTPLKDNRDPDLSFVIGTAEMIGHHLQPGQLIVLESTTYPGTTAEVLRPILERRGLVSDRDFYLAYSPEREDPGNAVFTTASIPKVIAGDGPQALELVRALYDAAMDSTVPVSSTQTAEAVKLTENIFRAVNIALVNELKVVFDAMDIDVWEVIEAAKTKPFGYMPFYPGPGLGGHCIPIDPFYLSWKAAQFGVPARFISLAGEVNTAMPTYVVRRLSEALQAHAAKSVQQSSVLMIGMAYKKNVDDTRESPALAILSMLKDLGASVDYHDPNVLEIPRTRAHPEFTGQHSVALTPEAIRSYDVVLICTDHDTIDYDLLGTQARLIVDTRNAMARTSKIEATIIKA